MYETLTLITQFKKLIHFLRYKLLYAGLSCTCCLVYNKCVNFPMQELEKWKLRNCMKSYKSSSTTAIHLLSEHTETFPLLLFEKGCGIQHDIILK